MCSRSIIRLIFASAEPPQVLSPASPGSDAELRVVSRGEEGHIVVAGAPVASGYYRLVLL